VNVTISSESSLWIADELAHLLSNKNLKETLDKNKLVRSKLLEELSALFCLSQLGTLIKIL